VLHTLSVRNIIIRFGLIHHTKSYLSMKGQ
jgi:hypothetical protein